MVELKLAQIDPVDQDPADAGIPEPSNKLAHRVLPAPERLHRRAGRTHQLDIAECGPAGARICEADTLERDCRAADRGRRAQRAVDDWRFLALTAK